MQFSRKHVSSSLEVSSEKYRITRICKVYCIFLMMQSTKSLHATKDQFVSLFVNNVLYEMPRKFYITFPCFEYIWKPFQRISMVQKSQFFFVSNNKKKLWLCIVCIRVSWQKISEYLIYYVISCNFLNEWTISKWQMHVLNVDT